ncbi:putative short chain dehydrogenase [Encephalitozoon hellem]|uniref:Short chain dehydrogenase n=1 Tax=Encephalitozoon hellem TaxID=27973 RepID=A0A9Q9C9T3_ENCHE|nr:putative short chain dehydrogenase [Encephalitozoon hellem ATCC 50504]AFM99149.1 putative short chain dehydrogenase [Encephalitozoon hellem ATCC 50504]KAG5860218.1 putative short chain dehydrogenase [Encephalitozoon hellem]UTX44135.1 putative short chain dehydrogenase [Encephalitozoon hellem]WEL39624.1 short chain dehydrogenase [Encephalitozoon hellem]|eukprot:XP_003888130.1 putative short chain dehydrogenase [Encephalitozoon hellem ATCC 50504]
MSKINLAGKAVCVTGGSRGLGLEIVKELAKRGSYVHVIGRSPQSFDHENIRYYQIDLLREKPDIAIPFDIVISNLGTSVGNKTFDDMEYTEVVDMLKLNVELHLWLLKNTRYKKFVFVNSILSQQGLPGYSMYCASKSFIHTLNQSLRREGKDTMIIYPYKINTSLFREVRDVWTLDANYVAVRLLNDIENGVREDFVPWIFKPITLLSKMVPMFVQDALSSLVKRVFYSPEKKNK